MTATLQYHLKRGLEIMGLALTVKEMSTLLILIKELEKWNKIFSFTSLSSPQDMIEIFILDSLTPLALGVDLTSPVLDAGSGPGFPSLPLKITIPSLEITAVDSSRKKTNFAKQMVRLLRLQGFTPLQERLESLIKEERTYPTVISRALTGKANTSDLISHLAASGGRVIQYIGKEKLVSPNPISPNLRLQRVLEYQLPLSRKIRGLVIAEKVD
jgi:16S rRNA (guanine527-N7)-methyltransferase